MNNKVAVIGPLCKDINIINNIPSYGFGGVSHYAGTTLHKLGIDTYVYATYSPDEKIDMPYSIINISAQTITFENRYTPGNLDERVQKATAEFQEITIDSFNGKEYDFYLYGPLLHDNISLNTLESLSNKSGKKVLCAQGMFRYIENGKVIWKNPEVILDAKSYIDYVALDNHELKFITKKDGIDEGAACFNYTGLIVTLGSQGSIIYKDGIKHKICSYPVNPKDPTGAGDTYVAGFIAAQYAFDDIVMQGKFASATAALGISQNGPFNSTIKDVLEMILD